MKLLWTVATARQQYLADVAPGNALVVQYNKMSQTPLLSVLTPLCAQFAVADDALARQLSAGLWPDNAKVAVAAFVGGLTQARATWQSCARATTLTDAYAATNALYDASPQAEAVRIALGLPGNS